jgi:hypothetical protein
VRRLSRVERIAISWVAAKVADHSTVSIFRALVTKGPRISHPDRAAYCSAAARIARDREGYRPCASW